MTVAIGLVCADGVVVAADSMSTSPDHTAILTGRKVNALSTIPAVWTASGSVYVIEEVRAALADLDSKAAGEPVLLEPFTTPKPDQVRGNLKRTIQPAQKECYQSAMGVNMIPQPGGGAVHPFATDFLVLGYANGEPYFLELAHDGQLNWHTKEGFYAVGSGGAFATVARGLMAHYLEGSELPVEQGLWAAYRTIETTCSVSSGFVGGPVQLAVVDDNGPRVLEAAEVDQVKSAVAAWKQQERDVLREAFETPRADEQSDVPPELNESAPHGT